MSTPICRLILCLFALLQGAFCLVAGAQSASGHMMVDRGELKFQARYKGVIYPILSAQRDEPVVVLPNGKRTRPTLSTMELVPVARESVQARPDWLYLKTETAEQRSATDISNGGSFNSELHLKFEVEATKPLLDVMLVVHVTTQRGPSGLLVRDVGNLAPFRASTVSFDLRLDGDMGAMYYHVYAFAEGRELWHPQRYPTGFSGALARLAHEQQAVNDSSLPQPCYCFAPRGVKKGATKLIAAVTISAAGQVESVAPDASMSKAEAASLTDSVRYWWFAPTRSTTGRSSFRIAVDMTNTAQWDAHCVQVLPAGTEATAGAH